VSISSFAGDQHIKEIVREWLKDRGVALAGPGILKDAAGKRVAITAVAMDWELAKLAGFADKGFTEAQRETAFRKVLLEDLEASVLAAVAAVAYNPSLVDEGARQLEQWVRGATGQTDAETLKVYATVMKHYIWQIKRKALRLPVTYHVAPLLVGGQGTGKTTAVNRLNAPLMTFTIRGRPLDEITDPRNYLSLSENLIVFLDEMGRAKTTCIDHLKTIITAEGVDYRPMRTNAIEKVDQNCTFIGASNKDIKAVIADTTGMRRFFQLTCLAAAKSVENHRLVNTVDTNVIWKSVDENCSTPYIASIKHELDTHQEDLRTTSTIEEYLQYANGAPGNCRVLAMKLFEDYMEFCERANHYAMTSSAFFREMLNNFGFERVRGAQGMFYMVNDELGKRVQPVGFKAPLKSMTEEGK
jgi:hypothetical protein